MFVKYIFYVAFKSESCHEADLLETDDSRRVSLKNQKSCCATG
jgi:hypothetical protein